MTEREVIEAAVAITFVIFVTCGAVAGFVAMVK